jgi:hypothetical protein
VPQIEVCEEALGNGDATPLCLRRISLLFQMLFELDKPELLGRPVGRQKYTSLVTPEDGTSPPDNAKQIVAGALRLLCITGFLRIIRSF